METNTAPVAAADNSSTDLNTRRRIALQEIDNAPIGWYHLRACIVAGVGFFTDQYDIFTVSMVTTMLGVVYWPQKKGVMPTPSDTAIKVATSGGTVIGQVGFGILADVVGRKRMYGVELIIIIIATLGQALSAPGPGLSIVGTMIFWRVIMGVGIGGDYPLSSIITSEFASTKWRGFMMAGVFSMQGVGQLVGGIVMLVVTVGFKGSLSTAKSYATCTGVCQLAVDKMWRVLIGFGAVPACLALYYRLTIPETPRYTFDIARDVEKAQVDVRAYMTGKHEGVPPSEFKHLEVLSQADRLALPKGSFRDFVQYFSKWKNAKILLGAAGSWFCLDVAFYGLGLNSSTVLGAIGWTGGSDVYNILYKVASGNIILVCAGALPGYWATMFTVDIIGRKPIQMMGFVVLTLLFLVWGFDYKNLSSNSMLGIYILAQFFFNFGPNATTFLVPGECFPTRYRSTGHGLSAASGKIGSIIAQAALAPLRVKGAAPGATGAAASPWQDNVMKIYAFFMLLGCFTTLLIPETKRKSLEQMSGEEDEVRVVEHSEQLNSSEGEPKP